MLDTQRARANAEDTSDEDLLRVDAASKARTPSAEDEDDDMDLPPLDEDIGEEEAELGEGAFDEVLPDLREDEGDPLDDSNAQDLDIGAQIDDEDTDYVAEEGAEAGLDIGPLDEGIADLDAGSAIGDEDGENGAAGDEDGIGELEFDRTDDDGGAEGTGENVENDVDEAALPDLDESEHDEVDDHLADELLEEAARGKMPPWASSRFVLLEGAGAPVPCAAVTVAGARVLAAGDVVLAVEEGAHAASPIPGFGVGKGPVALAATTERVWVQHEGALWLITDPEGSAKRVKESGLRAIAASGASLLALVLREEGAAIERLRGDDEAPEATPLAGDIAEMVSAEPKVKLAAARGGKRLALVSPRGLLLSNDSGRSFESIDLHDVVAACFAGEEEDASLLALMAPPGEAAFSLVRVSEDGEPSRVAEIAAPKDGTNTASIAWDASREVVWIASRQGLIALGPARKH